MEASEIILVQQLLGQYGHIVDAERWERFDELFTPDAVLDYTAVRAPEVLHGIDAIAGYFRAANHPSAHHVVNVFVYEDGDDEQGSTVRVRSKFVVPFTRSSHSPLRWYGGDYDDVVVPTDAGWRFARRVCTPRWQLTADEGDEIPVHRRTW